MVRFKNHPERVNEIDSVLSSPAAAEHVTTFGWGSRNLGKCWGISQNGKAHLDHTRHTITICPAEVSVGVERPLEFPGPEVNLQAICTIIVTYMVTIIQQGAENFKRSFGVRKLRGCPRAR